jgi:tripartite-type tricarboxylate transporter receptor subunit TctC
MPAMNDFTKSAMLAAAFVCFTISAGAAQTWPTRTITAIVPLAAGSASDVVGRVVLDQVSRQVGQPIVVENRAGAGGTIGANIVAKAAPDGYTILVYGALATAHALYTSLPYDTFRDFVPVVSLGQQTLVLVTAPSKEFKSLGDLVAAAKAKPGALNYSSAGIGSASHFAAERLRMSAGFEVQPIAFRGAAEALTELLAGRVDFSFMPIAPALSLVNEGKLNALAVSSTTRAAALPQVPTTAEAGLTGAEYPFWTGVFVPAKTPPEVIEKLHREIEVALQNPAVRERLAKLGVEPMPMSPQAFEKFFKDDVDAAVSLVKAAKIPTQ